MRYTIASLDTSGRIADQSTMATMGWHPGTRLNAVVTDKILLIRETPTGTTIVCSKARLSIPASIRHQAKLTPGNVFIAAAPTANLIIIHGLWCLDQLLPLHYRAVLETCATTP